MGAPSPALWGGWDATAEYGGGKGEGEGHPRDGRAEREQKRTGAGRQGAATRALPHAAFRRREAGGGALTLRASNRRQRKRERKGGEKEREESD